MYFVTYKGVVISVNSTLFSKATKMAVISIDVISHNVHEQLISGYSCFPNFFKYLVARNI